MSSISPRLFSHYLIILCLACLLVQEGRAQTQGDWTQKVAPELLEQTSQVAKQALVPFMVRLQEQADLSGAAHLNSKAAKAHYVFAQLNDVAQRSQPAVRQLLEEAGVAYQPFWVVNLIAVKGTPSTLRLLAQRDDVAYLYPDARVKSVAPVIGASVTAAKTSAVEWNVNMIGAPDVWAMGYSGQGVVIAGQDTGYDWAHPALRSTYRGFDGTGADHNYNWHDSIHEINPLNSGPNPCGLDSVVPCDDDDHGTHTMGTMVGDDGGANQIGVAPDAEWIGCRNMERGWGMLSTYIECFEWFLAPTDLSNQNPDPAMAPHVINNSWSCPDIEGCNPTNFADMEAALMAVRSAGTVVVVSAGNDGPSCETVSTPAAIFEGSFSIGSVAITEELSAFSSRGAVTVDGSNRLKPNVVAPGESVRSSIVDGGYAVFSGTSMAGPHVAGLVALIISANPDLAGDVDAIEDIIEQSSLPRTDGTSCSGVPGNSIPNNSFGYGRVDAVAAVEMALGTGGGGNVDVTITPTSSPIVIPPTGGTYQYNVTATNTGAGSETVDLWFTISGNGITFTRGPFSVTLAASQSISGALSQNVPSFAGPGTYSQSASVGTYPSADQADSFDWEKAASKGDFHGGRVTDWQTHLGPFGETGADALPAQIQLSQNYPNPFNPSTLITISLPESMQVRMVVYDVLGRAVTTLMEGRYAAGMHQVVFDTAEAVGHALPSGMYVYRLETPMGGMTRQMYLLK